MKKTMSMLSAAVIAASAMLCAGWGGGPAAKAEPAASAALLDAGGEAAITERQKKRIIFENIPNPMKIYTCVYFHVGLSRARENVINFLFGSFSLLVWNL